MEDIHAKVEKNEKEIADCKKNYHQIQKVTSLKSMNKHACFLQKKACNLTNILSKY